MSTDYNAACFTCRREVHLGQRMASLGSFGYGIADDETVRKQWVWLLEHLEAGHDVRIVECEQLTLAEEKGGGEHFTDDDLDDIVGPSETNPAARPAEEPIVELQPWKKFRARVRPVAPPESPGDPPFIARVHAVRGMRMAQPHTGDLITVELEVEESPG